MTDQARTLRVWVALVAAMTVGATALMVMDGKAVTAGTYSLSSYLSLKPVNEVTEVPNSSFNRWSRVEVFYSQTASGDIKGLAKAAGLPASDDVNFHFAVYNGHGTIDGQIAAAARWKDQLPCLPGPDWIGTSATIRICIVSDPEDVLSTENQVERTVALIESLKRKHNIASNQIEYPKNWQM